MAAHILDEKILSPEHFNDIKLLHEQHPRLLTEKSSGYWEGLHAAPAVP
jgi:hypothetical protein